jgi:hypothetical protein
MVDAVKQDLEITAARRERQILRRKLPKIVKIELESESFDSETDSDCDSDTERKGAADRRAVKRAEAYKTRLKKKTPDEVLVLIPNGEIDRDTYSPAHSSASSEKLDRSDLESSANAPDADEARYSDLDIYSRTPTPANARMPPKTTLQVKLLK